MTRIPRFLSSVQINSLCLILIYTLAISLFAPFAIKRIEAAPLGKRGDVSASKNATSPVKAPVPVAVKPQEQKSKWRDGELLVRFRENAPAQKMNALLRTNGTQWNGQLRGQSGIERLSLKAGSDLEAVAAMLRSSELVEFAEPNYLITADQTATTATTPNDSRFSEQWALKTTSVSQAWGKTAGSKQTVIAVIDSGIDFTHPDLKNNRWDNSLEQANNLDNDDNGFTSDLHGWDFVNDSSGTIDEQGHGTAIAGIIAAEGNNTTGITGVMWRAGLMSLRVLDKTGTGDIAGAIEAIDYATTNGAQVINCSWGTDNNSVALREAINRAAQRGVVVVASAGNDKHDIETTRHYPASFDLPNLISVAATDNSDQLTSFSNWGGTHVSIAAPGADILTTKMGGNYQTVSGTSASAALVTGVVGLVKDVRPWLNADRTREMILSGARQVPSLSDKVASKGIINAGGVLSALDTLPPNEGLDDSIGNNGGEHGNGRGDGEHNPRNRENDRPDTHNRNNRDHQRDGKEFSVTPIAPTRGAPATGLPNLDDLRHKQPTTPKAPDAVPSNRCSHHDPQCTKVKDKDKAAIDSPIDFLAWGLPSTTELFFADNSRPVSDTSFQLFRSSLPGLATMLPQPQGGNSAAYVKTDTTTQGDWKGKYGSEGYNVVNDAVSYPSYAQVNLSGHLPFTWVASTSEVRAPQKTTSTTDRLAACWYSYSYFTIDVNITDGQTHQIALYALDWDGSNGRAEQIDILDATTNTVLDSRSVSSFSSGKYLVWNLSGHVVIKVTRTGIYNSVISGIFFDSNRTNVALSANGGTATASSNYPYGTYNAASTINGDRKGVNWGAGGGWNDATPDAYPDWLQVDFNGTKTINEVDVFTCQDNYANPSEPTEAQTFTLYGLTGFEVQYWTGTVWANVLGGSVSGNNKVWRKFTFPALTTSKIRVLTSGGLASYSRLTEVEAWSGDATSNISGFSTPRVDPYNRTGSGGVDLLSGNANWSLPILGLKGRADLDLGLSLSYNSLVWTKSQDGTAIKFDADQGTPSPGFRLGFPVIQAPYVNQQTGKTSYLLVTPAGGHVDLRQVGTSNIYETGDSSFLQLIDNGGSLTLKPTDGSQLSFGLKNGQYQCTQIKDRNGNFMTINYDSINGIANTGYLTSIIDTLGRTINFNYDAYLNLTSITQTWGGVTHTWATFGWGNQTISTSFSGMTVVGPQNSTSIPVLTQIGFSDGTRYNFEYNSYAQVTTVRHYAADNHQLAYTSYTLPSSSSDCPRVTQSKEWAENWNSNQEATTVYSTAGDHSSGQATMPDGTIYKELFDTTANWQRSLTIGTEYWSGAVKKKWTATTFTQTNTGLNYQQNPRVIETNVYDVEGNRKRATIYYGAPGGSYEQWNLPYLVREYAADATTEIRHSFTDYNLSQPYLDRRIIGLVSGQNISDTHTWESIVLYSYDAGGTQLVATPNSTIQHDAAYGISSQWRGNLTTITRYDVTDIDNASKRAVSQIGYDTNGSVIFSQDPLTHQTNINYDDSFADGNNTRNTYAYPTKVTPPLAPTDTPASNFSSTAQYDYYMGAVTRTQGAVPAGQTQGPVQTFEYDAAGRISRINNLVNNAYQRWVYALAGHVSTYTLVQTGGQETFSTIVFDGMGRVRGTSAEHPNSVGLFRGQLTQYDVMGRVFKQSNPAEMDGYWAPVGEDAAGLVYTQQAYDWKGRPAVTTNPDGTTKSVTYGGCGCAGGEVVTVRDEMGRQQRVTSDILGRTWKTEDLDWYPSQTVHSTITNTYNVRDQVTSVVEQAGSTSQTTTLTYDGHGRLKTQQIPAQIASNTVTSYAYNADDTVQSMTDGRGAVTSFTYNNRQQVTNIAYSAPTGIIDPADVAFAYDAAGNRTSMSDGSGSVSYVYDQLSRLTSESRQFTGLPGTYTLSYGYNLASRLTNVTDPTGASISYTYDQAGRTIGVTGSSFGGVTQYASNVQYRAWGAIKGLSYGNNTRTQSVSYNNRLLPTHFEVPGVLSKNYEYHADGRLRYSHDLVDDRFDRSYTYDYKARLTQAFSGPLARGQADNTNRPYNQSFYYDGFDRLTGRTSLHWSASYAEWMSYANDRNTLYDYDADGQLTRGELFYIRDAAGRTVQVMDDPSVSNNNTVESYDGDGRRTKTVVTQKEDATTYSTTTTYEVRSSVLGGSIISELDGAGQKRKTFVYAGSSVLARQMKDPYVGDFVEWEHKDASGASFMTSVQSGTLNSRAELDPAGADAGWSTPYLLEEPEEMPLSTQENYPVFGNPRHLSTSYSFNGIPITADRFMEMANRQPSGAGFTLLFAAARQSNIVVDVRPMEKTYAKGTEYWQEIVYDSTSWNWAANIGGLPQQTPQNPQDPVDRIPGVSLIKQQQRRTAADPCAGNKGTIDPNKQGGLKAGITHLSDRHIEPQGSKWQRGQPNERSYFTFGTLATKGSLSATKSQKEDIVLGMMQEAFENGAANRLPGGDYAYSYAPAITFLNTPMGEAMSGIAYIGMDKEHGWDWTNVRTVVLRINNPNTDCQHPLLISGHPGLFPKTYNVNGTPTWRHATYVFR